jgi:hypothetical protein
MASIHSTMNDAGEPGPPYVVRFRWKPDDEGRLIAGRETFRRKDSAHRWVRQFDEARETSGWSGVRDFVLAWRARHAEADEEPEEPTLGEFMEDWFRRDAVANLAVNTIAAYLPTYNNHIRALPVNRNDPDGQTFGGLPLSEFAEPHVHQEFRESLRLTGRSKPNQDAARKVLSSALSWGVESRTYRRWLPTNGAKLTTTRRRRSNRPARQPTDARLPRSRVFNAYDYEVVRAELLARSEQRTWEPHRDAALVDLTFGCGLRPEEARGVAGGRCCGPPTRPRVSSEYGRSSPPARWRRARRSAHIATRPYRASSPSACASGVTSPPRTGCGPVLRTSSFPGWLRRSASGNPAVT